TPNFKSHNLQVNELVFDYSNRAISNTILQQPTNKTNFFNTTMAARRYNAIVYQPDDGLMCNTVIDLSDVPVLIEAVEVEMEEPAPALAPAEEQPVAAAVDPALIVLSSDGEGDH
ncbi:hypothetical protein BGX30_013281, partial [Mortierella sp. GBA39]